MPTVKVYNGDSFFDLTTDLSVFYISNDTYIQGNINHYFYYYTNVNDASSFTAAIRNHKANVSYFYNYGDSPNDGYYRIDNYGYGETIKYVPQNPLRNGYVFYGWYKEPECVNLWDFEIDRLPEAQYDEEGTETYQETKLYAKWIKNYGSIYRKTLFGRIIVFRSFADVFFLLLTFSVKNAKMTNGFG